MFFVTNRRAGQFSRYTACNTLFLLLRSHLTLKILIVGLVLSTSNVATAQLYGGYGVWGNNVMSHYGGYGNRVMNYYGNTTVNPVRPLTPYQHWYYNGRGPYRRRPQGR
jgi:hypothetical protein